MRHMSAALIIAGLVSVTGCKKEEVTSYRVPKEPEPAASKMPADHVHAGVAKSGAAGAGAQEGAAGAPATPSAAAPAGSPPSMAQQGSGSAMANTPVATASGAGLAWKGPNHWQDKGASGMRKGTFAITGEGGATGELAITAFPGDVGGDVANVNRWRGQVGLPAQTPDEVMKSIQRIEANGVKMGVVDMTGKDQAGKPTRLLGAMVPHGGATWFFKLTGPEALLAKEKDAFLAFLKTVKPAGN